MSARRNWRGRWSFTLVCIALSLLACRRRAAPHRSALAATAERADARFRQVRIPGVVSWHIDNLPLGLRVRIDETGVELDPSGILLTEDPPMRDWFVARLAPGWTPAHPEGWSGLDREQVAGGFGGERDFHETRARLQVLEEARTAYRARFEASVPRYDATLWIDSGLPAATLLSAMTALGPRVERQWLALGAHRWEQGIPLGRLGGSAPKRWCAQLVVHRVPGAIMIETGEGYALPRCETSTPTPTRSVSFGEMDSIVENVAQCLRRLDYARTWEPVRLGRDGQPQRPSGGIAGRSVGIALSGDPFVWELARVLDGVIEAQLRADVFVGTEDEFDRLCERPSPRL